MIVAAEDIDAAPLNSPAMPRFVSGVGRDDVRLAVLLPVSR